MAAQLQNPLALSGFTQVVNLPWDNTLDRIKEYIQLSAPAEN